MVKQYTPEQGDIVLLNFNPQPGHEQKGKRPALVARDVQYLVKTPSNAVEQVFDILYGMIERED